jgi:hypothetical protein
VEVDPLLLGLEPIPAMLSPFALVGGHRRQRQYRGLHGMPSSADIQSLGRGWCGCPSVTTGSAKRSDGWRNSKWQALDGASLCSRRGFRERFDAAAGWLIVE